MTHESELYTPNSRWHPASRDAYDERIAILMEGPGEPSVAIRRIAWLQAQGEEVIHRKEAELL